MEESLRHNFLPCSYNNIFPGCNNTDAWIIEVKYRSYDIASKVHRGKMAGSRRRHNFLPCPYNNISPDSKNMDA
jgi:hypothetical protein